MTEHVHTPVLLEEVITHLNLNPEKRFIDATLDGAGHTAAVLERYPGIRILGIELDPVQVAQLPERRPEVARQIIVVNDSYANLAQLVADHAFPPDAILMDLGLSSWHYEVSGRGFSFMRDEPLDMRFQPETNPTTAAVLLNTAPVDELERILATYGQEQFADAIAYAVVRARSATPIRTTFDLVRVIESAVPAWYRHRKLHCATKTFQALRVAINDELSSVANGVRAAIDVLNPGGRLAVISFQGMEDRIVREAFKAAVAGGRGSWVTRATLRPAWEEVKRNPRARSAKLKLFQKAE
ncbi:MAG: 16S rRNA (cytosine(1402)-N(4))-methyltransferase RsmH [Candidatus Paceibacterota bacterium]|nr:MAG: 16S rRNA (cytosine(1402)-N(4))-methyltransferase RsmH [Candidatus Paceibacterota bacterium]